MATSKKTTNKNTEALPKPVEPGGENNSNEQFNSSEGESSATEIENDQLESTNTPESETSQEEVLPDTNDQDKLSETPAQKGPFDHDLGEVTVESIGSEKPEVDVNVGLTKIEISYPEDFNGKKFFKNGDVKFVSKEVAAQLENVGIAKII